MAMGFIAGCIRRDQPVCRRLLAEASAVCGRLLHRGDAASPALVEGGRDAGVLMAGDPGLASVGGVPGRLTLVMDSRLTNAGQLGARLRREGQPPADGSDAAVTLAALHAWGTPALLLLRGAWALALHDAGTGTLICARDRFGQRPLHYGMAQGAFVFASELQALHAWSGCSRVPDYDALAHTLAFGHAPATSGPFQDLYRVLPGSVVMRFPNGRLSVAAWHDREDAAGDALPPAPDALAAFEARLDQSVSAALRGGRVGRVLGGSAPDAAMLASLGRLGVPASPCPTRPSDRSDAMQVMTRLLWHQGEPLVHTAGLEWHHVLQDGNGPVLSAAGAAELLAGHGHYLLFAQRLPRLHDEGAQPGWWSPGFRPTPPFARDLYHDVSGCMTESERMDLCGPALMHTLLFSMPDALGPALEAATPANAMALAARVDLAHRVPGLELPLLDAAAAATGAEVACPMLDDDIADWCLALPQQVLRQADGGHGSAYGLLGAPFRPDRKTMASPHFPAWPDAGPALAGRMGEAAADVLLSRPCLERGVFARTRLERMVKRHRGGSQRDVRALWAALCVELWFLDFVDQAPRPPVSLGGPAHHRAANFSVLEGLA